ncbi:uncharacterized protein LOC116109913 isoform X2 [Pistacia vera]|uniref:uncharacterized protein LOC116109913 isoform X2 n=1 Tax=Pistacia vera TaxID=55513 RepID=UPI0012631953|nr:uncharacterized protein LOC116109913 isoform X2 [Pistacia vera]
MELRSYSHLHHIQAIKGSLVIKTLNVSRGRPALNFKEVKEIYETAGAEHHDSIRQEDESECSQVNPNMVNSESPCLPRAKRRTIRVDTSEFNPSSGDEESETDLDDLSLVNMTLKQFKESCKARKRKCPKHVDSSEEAFENSFPPKQEYMNFELESDGDDLEELLSSWKSKITKNKKRRRKCIGSHVSTSSQSATTKPEKVLTDESFWHPSGYKPAFIDIKIELDEPDNFNCQTMICGAADSSHNCNEQVDSCGVVIDEAHVTASECVQDTDVSTSLRNEQPCVVNEESYEYIEFANPMSVSDIRVSGWEIMNVDIPQIISYQCPGFPVREFVNEGYIIRPALDNVSPEPISMLNDHNFDIYHDSQSHSSVHQPSWPSSSDSHVQMLDMAIDSRLQCMEIIDVDGAYLFEEGRRDELPSDVEAGTISPASDPNSSWSSDSCMDLSSCLVSVADDSPLGERKQLSLSACDDAASNCSGALHPFDATDVLTTPSGLGDNHHPKVQCPPERLLSNRKAISPTSQERLCKAMNSIDLEDDKHSECRGKLLFEKQADNNVIRAEGCNKTTIAGVTINTKQVLRKPKYDKKVSHPKGILKGPHLSNAVSGFSTGCTSRQRLSQSAIAFSQRQMQDIESLATKLTSELSYMKDIVKEMLYSEACPGTSLKHNMDEVAMAVKSANKTEETARKWLSMMARDCTRFCKIMKLTEAGSGASGNVVNKERKITFADEAGGKLCHVKVFKDDMTSQLECTDIEK